MFRNSNKNGSSSKAASETTPLATGAAAAPDGSTAADDALTNAAAAGAAQAATAAIQNLATPENLHQMSKVAAERVDEISKNLMTGNTSIRYMALLAGVAIVFFAATGILGEIFSFRWNGAVMEVYTLFFGCVMVLLESDFIKIPDSYMEKLYKYLLFLKFIWGRGVLYFIAGNLQFAQGGLFNFIVGGYTMFVGIMYVLVGRQSAKKLSELKHSIFSEETLKKKFKEADTDKDGMIDLEQFRGLVHGLDLDLTKRETEGIFFHLDTSDDNKLTYEEFSHWWNNFDAADAV